MEKKKTNKNQRKISSSSSGEEVQRKPAPPKRGGSSDSSASSVEARRAKYTKAPTKAIPVEKKNELDKKMNDFVKEAGGASDVSKDKTPFGKKPSSISLALSAVLNHSTVTLFLEKDAPAREREDEKPSTKTRKI